MTRTDILRIQKYLNNKFGNNNFTLEKTQIQDDSMEVHLGGEFLGLIYKDEDEGEISYAFQMAILEMDLPNAADASLI